MAKRKKKGRRGRRPKRRRLVSRLRSGIRRLGGLFGLAGKRRKKQRQKPKSKKAARKRPRSVVVTRPKRRVGRRTRRTQVTLLAPVGTALGTRVTRRRNPTTATRRTGVRTRAYRLGRVWAQRGVGFALGWVVTQFLYEKLVRRVVPAQWQGHWAGTLVGKGVAAGLGAWVFTRWIPTRTVDIQQAFVWGAAGNVVLDVVGKAVSMAGWRVPGLPVFSPTGVPVAAAAGGEEAKVQLPPSAQPGTPVQALPAPASQVNAMLKAIHHPSARNTIYRSPYIQV